MYTILLTFDGTVLELFGLNEGLRIHIAYRPEFHFEAGRHPRLKIQHGFGAGTYFSTDYDPARLEGLDRLTEHVRAAYRPR